MKMSSSAWWTRITNSRTISRPMSPASGWHTPTLSASCWSRTRYSQGSQTFVGSARGRVGIMLPCSRFSTSIIIGASSAPSIPSIHSLHLHGSQRVMSYGTFDPARSSSYTTMERVVNARPRLSPRYCQSSIAVASAHRRESTEVRCSPSEPNCLMSRPSTRNLKSST